MNRFRTLTPGFWISASLHAIIFLWLVFQVSDHHLDDLLKLKALPEFKLEELISVAEPESKPHQFKSVTPAPVPPPAPKVAKSETPPLPPKVEDDQAPSPSRELAKPKIDAVNPSPEVGLIEKPVNQESSASVNEVSKKIILEKQVSQSSISNQQVTDLSVGAWGAYGRNLARACDRLRYYPPIAVSNHWSGVVIVGVQVYAGGRLELNIQRSSGYKILDDAALDMVSQASKAMPVPDDLKSKSTRIFIPISFNS